MGKKNKLIVEQQLLIKSYEAMLKENSKTIKELLCNFYGIGQPLNDNVMGFNKVQLSWCGVVANRIQTLNGLKNEK